MISKHSSHHVAQAFALIIHAMKALATAMPISLMVVKTNCQPMNTAANVIINAILNAHF